MGLTSAATIRSMSPAWNTVSTPTLINDIIITHIITAGEAAQQADVRVGDAVVKVDDTDVRRANADLVQNLIA